MERGVTGVLAPYLIIPDRELLNVRWQRVEKFPESPGGDGFHFDDGHSRRSPFADSLSASSKKKSSLPAAESPSICSSHRLCSRRRNHRSEEHTSELQSPCNLVCRLLLEKKKK